MGRLGLTLAVPQDGRSHQGASKPTARCPALMGGQSGPLGSGAATSSGRRPGAALAQAGRGWLVSASLLGNSVTLRPLRPQQQQMASLEQRRTPGTCPVKQIGFFLSRLSLSCFQYASCLVISNCRYRPRCIHEYVPIPSSGWRRTRRDCASLATAEEAVGHVPHRDRPCVREGKSGPALYKG